VEWQPSLFDTGPAEPDVSYAGLRRIALDERSWVDYCPGWLAGADGVLDTLAAHPGWQQRIVTMWDKTLPEPRLTAGWSTDRDDVEVPEALQTMCRLLSARYTVDFDRVWVNLYRDGRDSVAWHGDRIGRGSTHDTMVAIIVLGAPRALLLRPRGGGRPTIRHDLGHGDLLVMGGSCQRTWEHAVPKTARPVGPRISVQFRTRGVR
jgi:alkylated DNA repair dioxygenase AlkB